ncbi:Spy/CpxP family protein refolding chaperone [Reyranella sp.]|uniref:Spy/CpxP family protein refolding chaperone n=1 Tax=Reyranella sp. TaxID=1929291 RepID=UPI00272F8FB5|nr:periplasmic heavy metal sensor [Reyranella sp.]MDP2377547.1 periplasmic heavy metal sensor [Reyranella sp.]
MSSRVMQLLLGLSLLLNCFVLAGFVYRSWIAPPTFETRMPPPPGARPSPIDAVLHDLGVDSGQRDALRDLLDGYAAKRRERLREIQKVREQSAAELKQPQIDLVKVDGLVDQLARLRADLQKENLRAAIQLEPALRPDQRERLRVLIAERFAGAPPPRPPGPPGGPPGRPPQ